MPQQQPLGYNRRMRMSNGALLLRLLTLFRQSWSNEEFRTFTKHTIQRVWSTQ